VVLLKRLDFAGKREDAGPTAPSAWNGSKATGRTGWKSIRTKRSARCVAESCGGFLVIIGSSAVTAGLLDIRHAVARPIASSAPGQESPLGGAGGESPQIEGSKASGAQPGQYGLQQ